MATIAEIAGYLEQLAPPRLAAEWDNVGLLVGDSERLVDRVMTCLTITFASAQEAILSGAGLIVAHHPLPLRPLRRLTTETTVGRLLLSLAENRIAVYSPHTAFDSAAQGVNEQLARGVGLARIEPLTPAPGDPDSLGEGRLGEFAPPAPLREVIARLKAMLRIDRVQYVGDLDRRLERAAIGCGSAGQFLEAARAAGCDLLITGETNFHTCLEASASGTALILPGHFASERFAVENLAERLGAHFPALHVWASKTEQDPLFWA